MKIIKKSLECLEKLTSFRRVELVLGTIRNISCEGPGSARAVVNEGVLELVLNLIRIVILDPSAETLSSRDLSVYQLAAHHGEAILQRACQVVSEIANVPGVGMEYCRLGGCETIVGALKWQEGRPTSILIECLKMIIYLTYNTPEAKCRMVASGIYQSIVKAMKCSNVIQNQAAADHSSQDYVYDPSIVVCCRMYFQLLLVVIGCMWGLWAMLLLLKRNNSDAELISPCFTRRTKLCFNLLMLCSITQCCASARLHGSWRSTILSFTMWYLCA